MLRRAALLVAMLMAMLPGSASAATATVMIANGTFTPATQTVTLGNAVRWQNATRKKHNATPLVNWSWGRVTVKAGKTSALVYPTQAGSFRYVDTLHPKLKGTIAVPITVDQSVGTTETFFKLTLGTVQAPGVSAHELYVRLNGGEWVPRVYTRDPTVSIFFPSAGTWDLRTRMVWALGSQTSDYSPITTLTVF
jgi:plastocyanin